MPRIVLALTFFMILAAPGMSSAVTTSSAPAAQPEIWMCHHGADQLGAHPESWPFVQQHIDVIAMFIGDIAKSDVADLRRLVELARANKIRFSIECAGLCDWHSGKGAEAAARSFADEYRAVRKFIDPVGQGGAGGTIDFLQLDHPVTRLMYPSIFGKMKKKPEWTLDSATSQLVQVMGLWRKAIPGIGFYLVSNFPNYGYGDYPAYHGWSFTGQGTKGLMDYKPKLEVVIRKCRAAGMPLLGVLADNPYDYAIGAFPSNQPKVTAGVDWVQRLLDLERDVEAQGLAFGLMFNSSRAGSPPAGSDALYEKETLEYLRLYRSRGGSPEACVIESWYEHPAQYLPESQPGTMTHLVKEVIKRLRPETKPR